MEKIETPEGPTAIPLTGGGYCSSQHAAIHRRKCRHGTSSCVDWAACSVPWFFS